MPDNLVVQPVGSSSAVSLAPSDAANAAAVEAAGVKAASDLGGFASPTTDELLVRVDLLERQIKYLRDNYVREHSFPMV